MQAHVLSWTRVDRPPVGFPPGRIVVLVEGADGARRYALWKGKEPSIGGIVSLTQQGPEWFAE